VNENIFFTKLFTDENEMNTESKNKKKLFTFLFRNKKSETFYKETEEQQLTQHQKANRFAFRLVPILTVPTE